MAHPTTEPADGDGLGPEKEAPPDGNSRLLSAQKWAMLAGAGIAMVLYLLLAAGVATDRWTYAFAIAVSGFGIAAGFYTVVAGLYTVARSSA